MKIRTRPVIEAHVPVVHGGRHSMDASIIDFSSNINPAGMPASVKPVIKKRLDLMESYPDPSSTDLVSALSQYTGLPKANLVVGNGAMEIVYNFCNAFLAESQVLIPVPTFDEYEAAAKMAGSKISFFKTMNLAGSLDSFIPCIPTRGCIFVCNPNNPTGTILSKRQMTEIVAACKSRSCIVFVDECFIELVAQPSRSVLNLVKRYDNLVVLRSLTKSFGLAGIRIGYAGASRQITDVLKRIKIPWSVNAIAQEAGIIAVKAREHLAESRDIIKKESGFLKDGIAGISGLECQDSSTNFILIKTRQDSTRLQKKLLKYNILIRDCKRFRGLNNHYIRVAIRSHKDNLRLIHALEAVAST